MIAPNEFQKLANFSHNQGLWNLVFAPIANPGADIPEGTFESSATIVAQFD